MLSAGSRAVDGRGRSCILVEAACRVTGQLRCRGMQLSDYGKEVDVDQAQQHLSDGGVERDITIQTLWTHDIH